MKLRVLIADDHSGMLEWLAATVCEEFDVVGTVQDGVAALAAAAELDPDVIVLDCAMSPMNGLEVTRTLRESGARSVVVLITGYNDPELAEAALTAGAVAFVMKSKLTENLLPAIRFAGTKLTSGNPSEHGDSRRYS